jgi:undecaprenyl-diphosphatase
VSPARVAAAVAALLVAGFALARRRRLGRQRTVLALVVAAALGVYASHLLALLPDPKRIIEDVATTLGAWTYVVVGLFAFLETGAFIGLVAPGETIILAGGVIAGQGEIALIPLIGLVWLCAILGDTTSFLIGRRLGRDFLERHGPKVGISAHRLEQVDRFFDRHGGKTILIGRFIGLVRAIAPFVAGSSGLAYRRFIPYSVVGTGIWGSAFCVLGYVFWQSFDRVASVAGHAVTAFGVVAGVAVAVVWAYRRLRDPEQRRILSAWLDRQERRWVVGPAVRAVRAAARVAAPRARFLRQRLTPGGLGLELTTALAVGGVGMYVFVLYTVVISGDPGRTPLDTDLLRVADDLRARGLTDVLKVLTSLGSLTTTATVVAATAILLASRRHPIELVALLVGFVVLYVSVQATKAAVDRPRPSAALVSTSGSSFPSAHAAYSTAWVAAAVVASEMLALTRRAALVMAAVAITALVGLSRIYLRAHYWSDVAGGWGIGFGIFGTAAAIGLVVAQIRHNARQAA